MLPRHLIPLLLMLFGVLVQMQCSEDDLENASICHISEYTDIYGSDTILSQFRYLNDKLAGETTKSLYQNKIVIEIDTYSYNSNQLIEFSISTYAEYKRTSSGLMRMDTSAVKKSYIYNNNKLSMLSKTDLFTQVVISGQIEYDSRGNVTHYNDGEIEFICLYDLTNKIVKFNTDTFIYNLQNQLIQKGTHTFYEYDSLGNIIQKTKRLDKFSEEKVVNRYIYDTRVYSGFFEEVKNISSPLFLHLSTNLSYSINNNLILDEELYYNDNGVLVSTRIASINYEYDNSMRVKKATTEYYFDGGLTSTRYEIIKREGCR